MGFELYTGNRLEVLAEKFVSGIYLSGGDPMRPETVIVQTQGMATWLKLFTGRAGAIAANLNMPFLNSFINGVLSRIFGRDFTADSEDFSHGAMVWHVFRILEDGREDYPELAAYISGGDDELKRWQLASRLAGLFDQYQIYRAGELSRWNDGERLPRFDWQRRIYNELLGRRHGRDWYLRRFLSLDSVADGILPHRITVFAAGAMPPLYVNFFFKLSEFIQVNFFYLSPCCEYWEHLYGAREAKYRLEDGEIPMEGNQLLASFGGEGREFLACISDPPSRTEMNEHELWSDFAPDGKGSMLQLIQQDILKMHDRPASGIRQEADDSVTVHNCHSRRREVEILHDRILHLLKEDSALAPRDIIVMAPDINDYAPYIEAVFSQGELGGAFSIADRGLKEASRTVDAFRKLMRLGGSRFGASEIMELLEVPAIRLKAGIGGDDIPVLRRYLKESGVCWGYDSDDRREICGIAFDDFSWQQGFDRLLMGFARVEPEEGIAGDGISGIGSIEGGDVVLLGNFIALIQRMRELKRILHGRYDAARWAELCRRIADDFFMADDDSCDDIALIRSAVSSMWSHARHGRCRSEISVRTVCECLDSELSSVSGRFTPFLRGKITFCSLVPMRSIPMQAVAVLGLNDGEFPRRDLKLGFNLMSISRKAGDKSHQSEDRYLFMEAILSARKYLMLFYQGQEKDDMKPPALPLAEFTYYLERCFGFREIRHKLQPFDFDYFSAAGRERGLISYSQENFAAGKSLLAGLQGTGRVPVRDAPVLNPDIPLPERLEISGLVSFWRNPCRYYLCNMLGMSFYDNTPVLLDENEPVTLDHLSEFLLKEKVLDWTLDELPENIQLAMLRGRGLLPVGRAGDKVFADIRRIAGNMPQEWRRKIRSSRKYAAEVCCSGCLLTGCVADCTDGGREHIFRRAGALNSAAASEALIRHLVLNMRYGMVTTSVLTMDKEHFVQYGIEPMTPDAAEEYMERILEVFRQGQGVPQPFFKASRDYAFKSGEQAAKLKAARSAFCKDRFGNAESGDPAIKRCFSPDDFDREDFIRRFDECAGLIFAPLIRREDV